MKRSHLIYGIVYTCIGVAFLLLALFTEYRLESLFWGLAGGIGIFRNPDDRPVCLLERARPAGDLCAAHGTGAD